MDQVAHPRQQTAGDADTRAVCHPEMRFHIVSFQSFFHVKDNPFLGCVGVLDMALSYSTLERLPAPVFVLVGSENRVIVLMDTTLTVEGVAVEGVIVEGSETRLKFSFFRRSKRFFSASSCLRLASRRSLRSCCNVFKGI